MKHERIAGFKRLPFVFGVAACIVVVLVIVQAAFAQFQGQKVNPRAVSLYGQWYTEKDPLLNALNPNTPGQQALYFYVLYEDGTIQKRRAPDR